MSNTSSLGDNLLLQLAELKKKIPDASEKMRPRLHNQAGDLHTRLGQFSDALAEYGNAVDDYVQQGEVQQAIAVCTKIIRRSPKVTRTHFTLACLLLWEGQKVNAIRSIASYTEASRESRTANMAIPRLRYLARVVVDMDVREAIAEELEGIGDPEGADRIRANPPSEAAQRKGYVMDPRLLDAATRDSAGIWADFWLK